MFTESHYLLNRRHDQTVNPFQPTGLNNDFFWPPTLLKKRFWHRCFLVKFAKCLRTPFLQNTSGRLLLKFIVLNLSHLYNRR